MYLYNVSIIIEESQHETLLSWLQQSWTPTLPSDIKFLKMLNTPHEGHTYCVQLIVSDERQIQQFQSEHIVSLQAHIAQHHNEKAFIFDSVMQYL
ncbi:DUF4286 family protein [Sphingobacterium paucimobilis]|uniref:DUF4286 domain-containing protein n=1 Tax=Sphingobacterium paucimobilis HER1398 TaxID=1346330 RepID=U2HY87_9SPHI|nr:DUF4286 family protein [Sphingobacterium paucimobilis]ERJ60512.1 hypothetical protein M472_17315 [Sphingobacterium paucimobilis HER1398]